MTNMDQQLGSQPCPFPFHTSKKLKMTTSNDLTAAFSSNLFLFKGVLVS